MSLFFRMFQHLLPSGRSWNITEDKTLRRFINGISSAGSEFKQYVDNVWCDRFPDKTRNITQWENEFALTNAILTEKQRRDRLTAAWKALGGQSPSYIQNTLQSFGFDVYVHEWWDPADTPPVGEFTHCVTPRNPFDHLRPNFLSTATRVQAGETLAESGEAFAESGNSDQPLGYPLVNKILRSDIDYTTEAGEVLAEAGETVMESGNFNGIVERLLDYTIPSDPAKWPYFLYIGGENFPDLANVPAGRRNEFEALCLKICPSQLWLGVLVEYD